jgi:hypothetical protein
MGIIRSAGLFWSQKEWRDVPERAAEEIRNNPFLEVEGGIQLTLVDEQPRTPETDATKMIYPRKRGRKV